MAKICTNCNQKIRFGMDFIHNGKVVCGKCSDELVKIEQEALLEQKKKEWEEFVKTAPKIQCPFCKEWFPKVTEEQYRDKAELNVLKWAIVPAWGVVGALKNKPYIECPHCKMKIMQG